MYDTLRNRWVTSMRINDTTEVYVRWRGNAKYDPRTDALKPRTDTASVVRKLKIEWDELPGSTAKRPKYGVVSVSFDDSGDD